MFSVTEGGCNSRIIYGGNLKLTEVPIKNESTDNARLHGMQTKKLRHYEKQKKRPRQIGKKQALQVLPQTHAAQRDKITHDIIK